MASQEDLPAPCHRTRKMSGAHCGEYGTKLHRRLRLKELAPNDASKAELLRAAILVLHRDPPSLMRNDKEKKMRDIVASLQDEDSHVDEAKVEEISASWLEQLEQGTVEHWEVYGAAMNFIAGFRRPHFAQKPRQKKQRDDAPSPRTRGWRKRRAANIVDEATLLNRELQSKDALNVVLAAKKLVEQDAIDTNYKDDALDYLEGAIGRLASAGRTPSLQAVEVYEQINQHLQKGEIQGWQVLRVAANRCHKKSLCYPAWARAPKAHEHPDTSGLATDPLDAEDREAEAQETDEDEFVDAFQDATSVPMNAVENKEPAVHDDSYKARTCSDEKHETFTIVNPPEDQMTIEQMKDKLEFYRLGSRRNPQVFLQKFIDLNNKICNEYEASQRQIREAAKKAREELLPADPSPSPERVPKQRGRVNIIGRIKGLEDLERQPTEHERTIIHGSDQKPKRQRVRKTPDAKPKTVEEALLTHLQDPVAAEVSKERANNDMFHDLFGPGPDDEIDGDLLEQLEVDLSEL